MVLDASESEASMKRRARKWLKLTRAGGFVKIAANDPALPIYLEMLSGSTE